MGGGKGRGPAAPLHRLHDSNCVSAVQLEDARAKEDEEEKGEAWRLCCTACTSQSACAAEFS